jgi:DNA-binding transcriptional ArsR family regulator
MVHQHPTDLDRVFGALAYPTRRAVLAALREGERSVGELAAPFDMSLTGFIKHLGILEQAGLVVRRKSGRVVTCRLTAGAMKGAREWLDRYESFWTTQLDRLGEFLERKEAPSCPSPSTNAPRSRSRAPTTSRRRSSTPPGRTRTR